MGVGENIGSATRISDDNYFQGRLCLFCFLLVQFADICSHLDLYFVEHYVGTREGWEGGWWVLGIRGAAEKFPLTNLGFCPNRLDPQQIFFLFHFYFAF